MGHTLNLGQAARFVEQIAGALDHAHERGILHRDVKPSNVLVDEGDWTLLTDFGLAKMIAGESQLTGSGVGAGTPAYMSPEQIMGAEVDRHSDIYALGVILYEMATGRVPYEAETPMAVALKHVQEDPPLPRVVNSALPETVERVVLKAMAKEPEHRYQSAGELAQTLKGAVEESATSAVPLAPAPQAPRQAVAEPVTPTAPTPALAAPPSRPQALPPTEAGRPSDLTTELQKPIPGLLLNVPAWIVLVLAVIGSLALIRFFLGGWFIFMLLVIAIFVVPYWLRPRQVGPDTKVSQRPFGPIQRDGTWTVANEEIWFFAADMDLDMAKAQIPVGETRVRIFGFAGDVDVLVPESVGVSVSLATFATDSRILGQKHAALLAPFHLASEDYETAERKLRLEIKLFAGDIKVRQV